MEQLRNFILVEDSGQDLIEYALLIAFLALGVVATMHGMMNNFASVFSSIGSLISSTTT